MFVYMNITNDFNTCNVNFKKSGGYYKILKDNETIERNNNCNLNNIDINIVNHLVKKTFKGDSLSSDASVKFCILSLSIIGVYVFSCILTKSNNLNR